MTTSKTPKLRVGIILDSWNLEQWAASVLAKILQSDYAELSLVIFCPGGNQIHSIMSVLRSFWEQFLFNCYCKMDACLFRLIARIKSEENAFKRVNVQDLIFKKTVASGFVVDIKTSGAELLNYPPPMENQLDAILNLTDSPIPEAVARAAKYGLWGLRHGDKPNYPGAAAYFGEMYRKEPVGASALEIRLPHASTCNVVYRSYATINKFSLAQTRNRIYWKSSEFFLRGLRELKENGCSFLGIAGRDSQEAAGTDLEEIPSNAQVINLIGNICTELLKRGFKDFLFREKWFVAFRRSAGYDWLDRGQFDGNGFEILPTPKDRFYADPFPVRHEGRNYIFFEDYRYPRQRAVISYVALDHNGLPSAAKIALSRDYHLSYPYIFTWRNDFFMIPETSRHKTVELYCAERFPDDWQLERIIFTGVRAVDSMIMEHNHLWWLFTNLATDGADTSDELHLFYADSPLGEWQPHKKNPIISDVRSARSAGRIFPYRGDLIRPSQDCSISYGKAIKLNKIIKMTKEEYEEIHFSSINPDWNENILATHTWNCLQGIEVIDGKMLYKKFNI